MNFFYNPNLHSENVIISGEEFRHGIKSMRKREGDNIYLVDGKGSLATAQIQKLRRQEAECIVLETMDNYNPLPYELHLGIAPTKNVSRWEWLLEKCTEIGCLAFSPMICEHSERRNLKVDRSNRILISAMKQSLKAFLPNLNALTFFDMLVEESSADIKFICTGGGSDHISKKYHGESSVQILIGPEGDFSPEEVELARAKGYIPVHLGSQRLRTETAAVVANTLIANHPKNVMTKHGATKAPRH